MKWNYDTEKIRPIKNIIPLTKKDCNFNTPQSQYIYL